MCRMFSPSLTLLMIAAPARGMELGPIGLQHDDAEKCGQRSGVHRWAEIGECGCGNQRGQP
jgi:hypothetical protein